MKRFSLSVPVFALGVFTLAALTGCALLPLPKPQPTATATLPNPVVIVQTQAPPTAAPTQALPTQAPPTQAPPPTALPTFTVLAPTVPPPTATSQPATGVPTETPVSPPKEIPVPAARQAISFLPNTVVYALAVNLTAGTPQAYTLNIGSGQNVFFTRNGNAVVQVSRPDGEVIVLPTSNPGPWGVLAGQQGNYIVVLKGAGTVTLGIYIPPAGTTPIRQAPLPAKPTGAISFQPNAIAATLAFTLEQGAPQAFTLIAQKGQLVSAITTGKTTLSWMAPDGNLVLPTLAIPGQWQFALPQSGANTLVFIGQGQVTLTVTIPPAAPPLGLVKPATRTRVNFAVGDAATTFTTTLASGSPQGYVLTVLGGQRIYVAATGQVQVEVLGAGDTLLTTLGGVGLWAVDVPRTGDYTVVLVGSGSTTVTIYVPPR